MITRTRPSLFDIMFTMRGSIVPRIAGKLAMMLLVSAAAVMLARAEAALFAQLSAVPFTLIGLSLSIFMSFRNNACYDRWWEARKLWGQLIFSCRSFARQVALVPTERREPMLLGLCAFSAALAARMRNEDEAAAVARWSDTATAFPDPNPTDTALAGVGKQALALARDGLVSDMHHTLLETQLAQLSAVQGGCERIKATPLPFAYALLLHRTAYAFCLLLPFALAGSLGWWTPLLVLVVSYTFFGLDALGDELEDPFGDDVNDLPLDAMVRTVEREMLAAAGRSDLPPPMEPVDHLLR